MGIEPFVFFLNFFLVGMVVDDNETLSKSERVLAIF